MTTPNLRLKPILVAMMFLQSGLYSLVNHASPGLESAAPWTNRITGQASVGENQAAVFIDDMLPVLGNSVNLLYVDGSFLAGQSDAYLASVGTGARILRSLYDRDIILGGFVFADYQQSPQKTDAWFVNPGFELLSNHQELRVQGYIPISNRNQNYRNMMASELPQGFLDDAGQSAVPYFLHRGHSFYDTPVALSDAYGTGLEAEAGQYLPFWQGGWLRAGYYHFSYPKASDIDGVEVNLELYAGKHASLIIQDSYDQQNKNKVMMAIRATFGGPDYTEVQHLSNRMEVPIIRHIARQSYGLATPIQNELVVVGPTVPTQTANWYFRTNGTPQDTSPITMENCTAENPCLNINQFISDGIEAVQQAATLHFASGTYNLDPNSAPATGLTGVNAVVLHNGQTVVGRTPQDWRFAASGTNRPLINGALLWGDNLAGTYFESASGTIKDMQVTNNDQLIPSSVSGYSLGAEPTTVIAVGATKNLTVSDTLLIAHNSSLSNRAPAIGAWSFDGDVTVSGKGSNITASTVGLWASGTDYFSYGLLAQSGNATFSNGVIRASTSQEGADAYGVLGGNNAIVNNGANIMVSVNGIASPAAFGPNAFGVASKNGYTSVSNSTISSIANGTNSSAYGVFSDLGNASVSNSSITSLASGEQSKSVGVRTTTFPSSSNITISNSTIGATASGTSSNAYGVDGGGILDFISGKSVLLASATGTGSSAQVINGTWTVNNLSTPQSTCNGVPCAYP